MLSLLAVAVVGCGAQRAFVSEAAPKVGVMRFTDDVAASTTAPGIAPAAVVFLSARHGFIATTGGGFEIPKTGWQPPFVPARIQETHDGGTTWHTVWSGRHIALQQLAFAGQNAIALGVPSNPPLGVMSYPRTVFALATADGGMHWHVVRPPQGVLSLLPAGRSVLGVGTARLVQFDGRRWRRLATPPGFDSIATFVSRRVGFAAGNCAGGQQLFRTVDGARTWERIPGTCGQAYTSLEVVDPHTVVTFQMKLVTSGKELEFFRRSSDGGHSWPILGTVSGLSITATHFADRMHGWGVEWLNSQGFFDSGLIHTDDGGHTWTRPAAVPAPPSAFAGTREMWAVDGMNDVVWRATDGARTWQAVASPRAVSVNSIDRASPNRLLAETTLGTLAFTGTHWVAARRPALYQGGFARIVEARPGWQMRLFVAGRQVALPGRLFTLGGAWFTTTHDGLVAGGDISGGDTRAQAWSTHDGGRTWRRVPLPPGIDPELEGSLGPDTLVVDGNDGLYVSADEGEHWSRFPSIPGPCVVSRPARTVWVACGDILLRSDDGSHSWKALRGTGMAYGFAAVSDTEAWALRAANGFGLGALWHTTDRGATWRRVAVHVDPTIAVPFRLPPYSLDP